MADIGDDELLVTYTKAELDSALRQLWQIGYEAGLAARCARHDEIVQACLGVIAGVSGDVRTGVRRAIRSIDQRAARAAADRGDLCVRA